MMNVSNPGVFAFIITIIGIIIALLGFVLAVLQWFRNKELKKALAHINKIKQAEIWTNIAIVARIFDSLEVAREIVLSKQEGDQKLLSEISSARRGTINHYLHLLKEAVLAEPDFNMETIEKWKNVGRLENEWRATQAIKLLDTLKMPLKPYPGIYRKTPLEINKNKAVKDESK